ncbi:ABC1 kinase family protein [Picrophilus oshimae]|uniref:Predicted unusual protein kinase regulating ubiquinone biosynthesis, AarF/ABC1/UbiB family n=1 Tax=Picrophilus torridus (strain ATCC 700027 / DSM 9790 / JCM 10055 / NBRC 100828 / KAW 2/3) TaxID=1122961 RepID=A0A8G2FVR3_PICTO|nr:AarF/UbiB family protein [Picrophilus oshimae]SMD30367.1 Predicted unusual protein kinase regulating ubiquinone biosynthesis, AarF/ABC1/UbiB family [Picrophilus oshimae DSM 9789]
MSDEIKDIRKLEIKYVFELYPVFRRYIKDRKRSRSNDYNYDIERHGLRAVNTFIRLGPTFIKLGQVLSARPDLLPKEYLKAFEMLQDNVPPDPFEKAYEIIKRNIDVNELNDLNKNAISGASLGQVYRLKYHGRDAIIKVNRYNINYILKRDIIIIKRLLRIARHFMDNFLYISIYNVIEDFSTRIYEEANYEIEANNLERIKNNLSYRNDIIIPEVLYVTKEVMILEYRPGIKVTDVKRLKEKNIDLKDLAYRIDLIFLRMLLRDDIFHADPHPGNIAVSDDGNIILYDFGMVGKLDDDTRFELLKLYDGLVNKDPDAIIDSLLSLNALSPAANRGIIRKAIEISIANFSGRDVNEIDIRELLEVANNVIFEFPFHLPRELVLYIRMSSLLEGICKTLDPNFKFVRVLRTILYDEGMLDYLYNRELSEFIKRAVASIEKGLDVLPLMKRRLEEENTKRDKTPLIILAGSIFIAMAVFSARHPLISYIIMALDLILSFYYIRKMH